MKFLLSVNYIVWLVLSAVFFAIVEFLSKKFALSPKLSIVALIVVADVICILLWLPAILQKNSLSVVGAMWSVLALLLTVLIGVLIFGEKLTTLDIIGIITAFIAVTLLSLD